MHRRDRSSSEYMCKCVGEVGGQVILCLCVCERRVGEALTEVAESPGSIIPAPPHPPHSYSQRHHIHLHAPPGGDPSQHDDG